MAKKTYEIKIRCTELLLRKLLAICSVKDSNKTNIIESLINMEYEKNAQYASKYYENLKKPVR